MSTVIIVVVLVLICIYSVQSYSRKLAGGCCGGGDGPEKKVRVADKNKANYTGEVLLSVEGMTCGNCARRVENALNRLDGVWAKVDLNKKQASVLVKTADVREKLEDAVRRAGYGATEIEWKIR